MDGILTGGTIDWRRLRTDQMIPHRFQLLETNRTGKMEGPLEQRVQTREQCNDTGRFKRAELKRKLTKQALHHLLEEAKIPAEACNEAGSSVASVQSLV